MEEASQLHFDLKMFRLNLASLEVYVYDVPHTVLVCNVR